MSGKPVWLSDDVQKAIEQFGQQESINRILEVHFIEGEPVSQDRVNKLEDRINQLEELART